MTIGWSYIETFNNINIYTNPSRTVRTQALCDPGEKYEKTTNNCVPCPDAYYQDNTNHRLKNCKSHPSKTDIECPIEKYLSDDRYTDQIKRIKNKPINNSNVCVDDEIYLRLKSLKNALDNNDTMTISQNDIKNMLTFQKVSDFRLSSDVVAYDETEYRSLNP